MSLLESRVQVLSRGMTVLTHNSPQRICGLWELPWMPTTGYSSVAPIWLPPPSGAKFPFLWGTNPNTAPPNHPHQEVVKDSCQTISLLWDFAASAVLGGHHAKKNRLPFSGGSAVKNLPAVQEAYVQSLGQKDPLEEGMATHSSILAWRIPWTQEPGRLQSVGLQRVRHDWSDWACTHASYRTWV